MGYIGGAGMIVALILPVLMPYLPTLYVSQTLLGLGQVCMLVSYQKTAGNWPGDRDKWIMLFALTGSCGELFGSLISGFSYEYLEFQWTYTLLGSIGCLALLLGLFLGEKTWKSSAGSSSKIATSLLSSIQLMSNRNFFKAVVASGLVLYSKDLFMAYFPLHAQSLGMTASSIGLILSATAAAGIAVRLLQVWLVRMFGRSKVLFVTMFISGISFAFIPFQTDVYVLIILAIFLGAGLGLGQPISLVYAMNFSPDARQREVLGMRLTFNRFSQFSAPFLFGAIGGAGGLMPIFLVSGIVLVSGSILTKIRNED